MDGHNDPLLSAELLCDQLTHQVGGNIGMLANLIEVATERNSHSAEALVLAGEIANQLTDQLNLLRAAWGSPGETLDVAGLQALAAGLKHQRCLLRLDGLAPETLFTPDAVRMVLNLLLLAAVSLPSGGDILLSGTADDLVIAIAGVKAAWPAGLAACVANPDMAWECLRDMRRWQAGLTTLLATRLGFRLSILISAGAASETPPLRLTAV